MPIFDTAFAILRRLINKRPIMEADKGHLHHRLMSIGLGQRKTVLSMYFISAMLGAGAIALLKQNWLHAAIILGVAAVVVFIPINRSVLMKKKDDLDE